MDAPERRGMLYLVATPIGNLEDITLRALRILKEADLIAAEDTRRTRKLLSHYGISRPLVSCFEQNEEQRIPSIVQSLKEGKNVALVSDAGSPGVSDPGYRLVRALVAEGIPFTAVPGPSALIAALSLAGLPAHRFSFYGFLPRRGAERRRLLEEAASQPHALVFFESPHRIRQSVADLLRALGSRDAALCRELTKRFEEVCRGTLAEILQSVEAQVPKGELCLVVAGPEPQAGAAAAPDVDPAKMVEEIRMYRAQGMGSKQISLALAGKYGLAPREVYRLAHEAAGRAAPCAGGVRQAARKAREGTDRSDRLE
ncbi:MAG: 16S rRNA (cytidine(1402)-2'-O)-methyltransferase [bacterium]